MFTKPPFCWPYTGQYSSQSIHHLQIINASRLFACVRPCDSAVRVSASPNCCLLDIVGTPQAKRMQRLGRQLLDLRLFQRPAADTLSGLTTCSRTYSAAAQATTSAAQATPHSSDGKKEQVGIKTLLTKIMYQRGTPLTSDDIWTEVAKAGGRSKTHTKSMLAQMKKAGLVGTTVVDTRRRRFGYYLKPDYLAKVEKLHGKSTVEEEQQQ